MLFYLNIKIHEFASFKDQWDTCKCKNNKYLTNNDELKDISVYFVRFLLYGHFICLFPMPCSFEHIVEFLVDVYVQNVK